MTAPTLPQAPDEAALYRRVAEHATGYDFPTADGRGRVVVIRGNGGTFGILRTGHGDPAWWTDDVWTPNDELTDTGSVYRWAPVEAPILAEQLAQQAGAGEGE